MPGHIFTTINYHINYYVHINSIAVFVVHHYCIANWTGCTVIKLETSMNVQLKICIVLSGEASKVIRGSLAAAAAFINGSTMRLKTVFTYP